MDIKIDRRTDRQADIRLDFRLNYAYRKVRWVLFVLYSTLCYQPIVYRYMFFFGSISTWQKVFKIWHCEGNLQLEIPVCVCVNIWFWFYCLQIYPLWALISLITDWVHHYDRILFYGFKKCSSLKFQNFCIYT